MTMWFTGSTDKVSLQIIEILSSENGLTIEQIDKRLTEQQGVPASPATLYRRITNFQERHVIVRHHRRCYLNPLWIKELAWHAAELQTAADQQPAIKLPEREGGAAVFSGASLRLLYPIWNLAVLEIGKRTEDRALFGYQARAWYALGMTAAELSLFRALHEQDVCACLLYGECSAVDAEGAGLVSQVPGVRIRVYGDLPDPPGADLVWAGDRYTVECVFPRMITQQFAQALDAVNKVAELDRERLAQIFDLRCHGCIRVVKSRKRAAGIRQALSGYF